MKRIALALLILATLSTAADAALFPRLRARFGCAGAVSVGRVLHAPVRSHCPAGTVCPLHK